MTTKTPEQEAYLAGVAAAAHQISELRAEVEAKQKTIDSLINKISELQQHWAESHADNERLRAEVALLRESVHLVQEIMDGLATKHSGCDCEWHRAWVVFDNAKCLTPL